MKVRGGGDGARDRATVPSGPGLLEIFSGDPAAGGTLLASNSDLFSSTHVYTAADTGLSVLTQLPEGNIFVRATDQAGNASVTNFTIDNPLPPILRRASSGRPLIVGRGQPIVSAAERISFSVDFNPEALSFGRNFQGRR